MRKEVIKKLTKRIEKLRKIAKPNEIKTGMSGSFIRFNMYLQSHTAMTQQEFDDCTYDAWLEQQHKLVYNEVNSRAPIV